jgi:hypothetical protein
MDLDLSLRSPSSPEGAFLPLAPAPCERFEQSRRRPASKVWNPAQKIIIYNFSQNDHYRDFEKIHSV